MGAIVDVNSETAPPGTGHDAPRAMHGVQATLRGVRDADFVGALSRTQLSQPGAMEGSGLRLWVL